MDGQKHWGTFGFYLLMIIAVVVILAQGFSHRCRSIFLNQFHLKQDSFLLFATVHFIPPMYNFANEVWYSDELLEFSDVESIKKSTPKIKYTWFNHYPTRIVTFGLMRHLYVNQPHPQYLYLRSTFMGQTSRTVYKLIKTDNGLLMQRLTQGDDT